jgi:hypothetical protein
MKAGEGQRRRRPPGRRRVTVVEGIWPISGPAATRRCELSQKFDNWSREDFRLKIGSRAASRARPRISTTSASPSPGPQFCGKQKTCLLDLESRSWHHLGHKNIPVNSAAAMCRAENIRCSPRPIVSSPPRWRACPMSRPARRPITAARTGHRRAASGRGG